MQAALRRCAAASVPRCLPSRTISQSRISTSRSAILSRPVCSPKLSPLARRAFSNSILCREQHAAQEATAETQRDPVTQFADLESLGLVHRNVVRIVTDQMGLSKMTDVQTATIHEALSGMDLVGQAKTGTGKTLAFLLPIFQRIIAQDPSLAERSYGRTSASDIRAIVISPTRELAEQIAVEAKRLSRGTGVIVQAAVGGTQKGRMLQQTRREGCHVLVATPGRLADLLSDPSSGIDAPKLNMFVLDEADRLLDQGFWQDIQNIRRMLPEPRENNIQTLMFSATIPKEVVSAVRETLKPGFRFVKCVRDDEEPTHARVPQKVVECAGMQNFLPVIYELCLNQIQTRSESSRKPFKAIVYFNSTAMVALVAEVFENLQRNGSTPLSRGFGIYSMHSRLSQHHRTIASDSFRRAQSGILLSSDVTARGMDFPDVTHVIQVGAPPSAEQYVHRIGRTGRAGKEGIGYTLIHPLEQRVLRQRLGSEFPLQRDSSLESASADMTKAGKVPQRVASILQDLQEAHRRVRRDYLSDAYRSLIGAHQAVREKQDVVDAMNDLARYGWGLETPPALSSSLIQKLGYGRTQGLVTLDSRSRGSSYDDFGGSGGRGSGGRGFGDRAYSGGSGRSGDAFDQAGMAPGERGFRAGSSRDAFGDYGSGGGSRGRRGTRW